MIRVLKYFFVQQAGGYSSPFFVDMDSTVKGKETLMERNPLIETPIGFFSTLGTYPLIPKGLRSGINGGMFHIPCCADVRSTNQIYPVFLKGSYLVGIPF